MYRAQSILRDHSLLEERNLKTPRREFVTLLRAGDRVLGVLSITGLCCLNVVVLTI